MLDIAFIGNTFNGISILVKYWLYNENNCTEIQYNTIIQVKLSLHSKTSIVEIVALHWKYWK